MGDGKFKRGLSGAWVCRKSTPCPHQRTTGFRGLYAPSYRPITFRLFLLSLACFLLRIFPFPHPARSFLVCQHITSHSLSSCFFSFLSIQTSFHLRNQNPYNEILLTNSSFHTSTYLYISASGFAIFFCLPFRFCFQNSQFIFFFFFYSLLSLFLYFLISLFF